MSNGKQAFTLIELSIVLVIIGLIVGGVLVGRDLIKAAQVRSAVSQIAELNTATSTFYGKFNYLPGDIPNPASFGLFTYNTYYTGGNSDGIIQDENGLYPIIASGKEPAYFIFHLADAGLVKFKYILDYPLPYSGLTDYQFLRFKLGNGGIIPTTQANGKLNWFLGITNTTAGGNPYLLNSLSPTPMMTPSEAFMLDQKMDDGLPLSGSIISTIRPAVADTVSNNCITSVAQNTYNLSNALLACNLLVQYK